MANETRLRQNFLGGVIENDPLEPAGATLASPGLSAAPLVDATSHLPIVIDPDGVYGEPEVVYVTAHAATSSNATILRAQEGTTARLHRRDTPWVHGPTKLDWEALTVNLTGGYERTTATYTTASLAAGAQEVGTIPMAKGYRLYAISTTVPARVRLYTTIGARDADLTRPVGTDPATGAGVILDYGTVATDLSDDLSPLVDGFDAKATPDGNIPIAIDNWDTATTTVGVTLTYVRTE